MKKISIITLLLLTGIMLILVNGCIEDFDDINVNPNAATKVPSTNVLGRGILSTASVLYHERLGIYYTGSYAGHTAAIGLGDYEYRVDINNNMWRNMYIAMSYLVNTTEIAQDEGSQAIYAAALTMKAYNGQFTTDMWGRIPYTEAFKLEENGSLYPIYDDQKTVYTALLAELKEAADIFKTATGSVGIGDLIYKGDIAKWRKFCNSVRLRAAIRISNVDQAMAIPVISEVLGDPGSYPVLEANSDNAYLWFPGVSPDNEFWYNRLGTTGAYTDNYRMNDVIISTLKTLNDPRLPVYARTNKYGGYNGYKFGLTQLTDTMNNANNVSGIGVRFANNPAGFSPFMHAAEVSFIKAEAYQRGLATGDAKAAYEKGITLSLTENGIAQAAIDEYLAQPEVAWDAGTTSNLEKINLQKWISLFKQSEEAWAEARRTDVPLMTNISKDYATDHNRPPFRLPYPDEEKSLNTNFPTEVKEVDIFWGTQVWWDTRTGVR